MLTICPDCRTPLVLDRELIDADGVVVRWLHCPHCPRVTERGGLFIDFEEPPCRESEATPISQARVMRSSASGRRCATCSPPRRPSASWRRSSDRIKARASTRSWAISSTRSTSRDRRRRRIGLSRSAPMPDDLQPPKRCPFCSSPASAIEPAGVVCFCNGCGRTIKASDVERQRAREESKPK